jgi:hypothetical protein
MNGRSKPFQRALGFREHHALGVICFKYSSILTTVKLPSGNEFLSGGFFILINTDYPESATTAADAVEDHPSRQSRARGNKRSISCKRKKYAPDKRQLKLDFVISQEENTGGTI